MIKGRIIKGVGGLYSVDADNKIYECTARGLFRKNKIVPTVGDFVVIEPFNAFKGHIHKILERKNELLRPRVSNIDICIITFSAAKPSVNFDLLDRFLIFAEYNKINSVICINKCDIADSSILDYISRVYSSVYDIFFTSSIDNMGIEKIKNIIQNKVSVFAGPSGVGKSSIINKIVPSANQQTGDISHKIERGKHTTRQVNLITVSKDTYIVDSPGFTSLYIDQIPSEQLQFYFKEFVPFLGKCRFNDCLHIKEPDCLVKEHIGSDIASERYERYEFLFNEIKKNE